MAYTQHKALMEGAYKCCQPYVPPRCCGKGPCGPAGPAASLSGTGLLSVAIGTNTTAPGANTVSIGPGTGGTFVGANGVYIGNTVVPWDATTSANSILVNTVGLLATSTVVPTAPLAVVNWDRTPGVAEGATALVTRAAGRMYLGVLPVAPTGATTLPVPTAGSLKAGLSYMVYDNNTGEVCLTGLSA